jgi:hypothetical protein
LHLLGKSIRVDAIRPNGTVEHLIDVPQYEFQWQGNYVYRNPVKLPRGTVVRVEGFDDKSDANTQNPNSPPKDVRRGEASTDKMCGVVRVHELTPGVAQAFQPAPREAAEVSLPRTSQIPTKVA